MATYIDRSFDRYLAVSFLVIYSTYINTHCMYFICDTYLYKCTSYFRMLQICMHGICLTVYMCGADEANVFNKCTSVLQQYKCYMYTSPYVLHMCDSFKYKSLDSQHIYNNSTYV